MQRSLYGPRDAPQIWQEELRGTLETLGYQACISQPGVYMNVNTQVRAIAHVDDIMAVGPAEALLQLQQELQAGRPAFERHR